MIFGTIAFKVTCSNLVRTGLDCQYKTSVNVKCMHTFFTFMGLLGLLGHAGACWALVGLVGWLLGDLLRTFEEN